MLNFSTHKTDSLKGTLRHLRLPATTFFSLLLILVMPLEVVSAGERSLVGEHLGSEQMVYYVYEVVSVDGDDLGILVPRITPVEMGLMAPALQQKALERLKEANPEAYGGVTIHVNPDRSVAVTHGASPAAEGTLPEGVVGELVYSLTEQGATRIYFQGVERPEPHTRSDVDIPAFAMVAPLWRLWPPQPIPGDGFVRLDDGRIVTVEEVRGWVESKDAEVVDSVRRSLRGGSTARTLAAINSLAPLGLDPGERRQLLLGILDHPSRVVREEVVSHLARDPDRSVLQALAERMGREDSVSVRERAAVLLRESGEPEFTVHGHLFVLERAEHLGVERAMEATRALASLGDRVAVPGLAGAAAHRSAKLRLLAVKAIGDIGDYRQLAALIAHPDVPRDSRQAAAVRLARDGEREDAVNGWAYLLLQSDEVPLAVQAADSLAVEGDRRVLPWLLQGLEHPSVEVRLASARGLVRVGDARAIKPLLEHAQRDGEEGRAATEQAVALISTQSVDTVLRMSSDPSPSVRRLSIAALGQQREQWIRDKRTSDRIMELLRQALDTEEPSLREAAVRSLGKVGTDEAFRLLAERTGDEAAQVRGAVAWALSWYEPPQGTDLLNQLLDDVDDDVRLEAVEAARRRRDEATVERLITYRRHGRPRLRVAVIRALAEINPVRLQATLREVFAEAVFSQEPGERLAAVEGLSGIRDPRILDVMSVLLQDMDEEVQSAAIRAYGASGFPQAIPVLRSTLRTGTPRARLAVVEGLLVTSLPEGRDLLREALESEPDQEVRRQMSELKNESEIDGQ